MALQRASSDDDLADYETLEEGRPWLEWLVPAAILNAGRIEEVDEEWPFPKCVRVYTFEIPMARSTQRRPEHLVITAPSNWPHGHGGPPHGSYARAVHDAGIMASISALVRESLSARASATRLIVSCYRHTNWNAVAREQVLAHRVSLRTRAANVCGHAKAGAPGRTSLPRPSCKQNSSSSGQHLHALA